MFALLVTLPVFAQPASVSTQHAAAVEVVDPDARYVQLQGPTRCTAEVEVDARGVPVDARVAGCEDRVRGQVSRALMRWTWTPARRDGQGLASTHGFEVRLRTADTGGLVTTWTPIDGDGVVVADVR